MVESRSATRLPITGVGLAAVRVLPALERLCHFYQLLYLKNEIRSRIFAIFFGNTFDIT